MGFVFYMVVPFGVKDSLSVAPKGRSSLGVRFTYHYVWSIEYGSNFKYPVCYNWNYYFYKNLSKEKINRLFSMWKATTWSLSKKISYSKFNHISSLHIIISPI